MDDENTLSVTWAFERVPKGREPYDQGPIPSWHGPIKDPVTGRWLTSHVMNQDFIAWAGQGVIADRTKEHVGLSDRGNRDAEKTILRRNGSCLRREPTQRPSSVIPV